jgi:hypothetical protein
MHRRVVNLPSISSQVTRATRRTVSNTTKSTSYVHATTPSDPATRIPDDRITPPDHGVPPEAFPSSAMYTHHPEASQGMLEDLEDAAKRPSSSSATPAHPGNTRDGTERAGKLDTREDGVGWSSAVRHRSAPGEMAQGGDGGLGLMDSKGERAGKK